MLARRTGARTFSAMVTASNKFPRTRSADCAAMQQASMLQTGPRMWFVRNGYNNDNNCCRGIPPQRRTLSSTFSYKDNPFKILGIPDNSSFEHVKQTFIGLALKKHPDVNGGTAEEFVQIREAFESILEIEKAKGNASDENNKGTFNANHTEKTSDGIRYTGDYSYPFDPDNWQSWFHQRTGMTLSFDMCENTRKEVVRAYRTMASGGKDKGGYWELARQLSEHDEFIASKSKKSKGTSSLLLSPSSSSNNSSTSIPKRRRRKW